MTRFLTILALPVLFSTACISPYTKRLLINTDPAAEVETNTIYETVDGELRLLMGLLPLSSKPFTPDIKLVLESVREKYGCDSLRNIDIEYYNYSYIVVSRPRMILQAECIGGGSILDRLPDL